MRVSMRVLIFLLVAFLLRFSPFLYSGLPFSTDGWPLIRDGELLSLFTPIHLGGGVFDGYNNFWPFSIVFGAVFSRVVGVGVRLCMASTFPFIGGFSVLVFYLIVRRFFGSRLSFIASILFASFFSHAYFTGGVTKGTYANPLYFLLIFVFLNLSLDGWVGLFLFSIFSLALIFTHHLALLVVLTVLFGFALAFLIGGFRVDFKFSRVHFLSLFLLVLFSGLYYLLYAGFGFRVNLTLMDYFSVFLCEFLFFVFALLFLFNSSFRRYFLFTFFIVAFSLIFIFDGFSFKLMTSIPSRYSPIYICSQLLIGFLAFIGFTFRGRGDVGFRVFAVWFMLVLGLEFYAVFYSSPISPLLAYRVYNFLAPILCFFSALGFDRLFRFRGGFLFFAFLLLVVLFNFYSFFLGVFVDGRFMGGHWLYREGEFVAGGWVKAFKCRVVGGDMKVSYLLRGYFGVGVDVWGAYRCLTGFDGFPSRVLFIYDRMFRDGFILRYDGIPLDESWIDRLFRLNFIYSNGCVDLFYG